MSRRFSYIGYRKERGIMEQYGQKQQFICAKCGCTEFESGQFQATGGNFAKLFDVQNKNSSLFPASGAALLSFTGRKPTPAGMCLISCLAGKYFYSIQLPGFYETLYDDNQRGGNPFDGFPYGPRAAKHPAALLSTIPIYAKRSTQNRCAPRTGIPGTYFIPHSSGRVKAEYALIQA